ncbi:hypothetical protein HDG34_003299 [Paraburkholderia sp. HC6.4b]|uniref:hypothetical protein n=1 Tax=unclassified Paraburkholderia TaxID=2615204 RepID=UPI0016165449|nr:MULTISPECIES: hypothetical protein [unclassified Paraburkholderia]MBB5409358.1 hypothetical protein [Paraburkholderia sp. HC6.4b]MBB5451086.1 hypothetical protein [Paraburkholderia sp. Kb1A]
MRRISARTLLDYSTESLWGMLHGTFRLMFDDGELQVDHRSTLYSSYGWDLLREYPAAPVLMRHHVTHVLDGRRLDTGTHLKLLANVAWDVLDAYESDPVVTVDRIGRRTYEIVNTMYNDLSLRLEEYIVSFDISDFVKVVDHPPVVEAKRPVYAVPLGEVTDRMLEDAYSQVGTIIREDPALDRNPIVIAARSGTVRFEQLLECVAFRGKITDIDSNQFELPVLPSFTEGIRSFRDSLVESRSAAKSLFFAAAPLQDTEYFSRRLQLMSMNIQRLHHGDCGTDQYSHWMVRTDDIALLAGMNYLDEASGELRTIRKRDTDLVGRTIRLRTVLHCAHPDPAGVCSACFGELSRSVPKDTNIGHLCCMLLTEKSSQSVLAVKHLDRTASIEPAVLHQADRQFLRLGADENSYLLAARLKGRPVRLIIPGEAIPNINDIFEVENVENLNIARFSQVPCISIVTGEVGVATGPEIPTRAGQRVASITHELMRHIRKVGLTSDERGNHVIDMEGWNSSWPILALPLKHFSMADHSKDIAKLLESSVGMMQKRDKRTLPDDALVELFDLVNSKLDVNLTVLAMVLRQAMIVSAETLDYSLPKPWTTAGLGVMSLSMKHRSLSAAMAFEHHREVLTDPVSFIHTRRMDHPFDVFLSPREILQPETCVSG